MKVDGQITQVSEVIVEHNVRFKEMQTRAPGEQPLLIMGQQLHRDAAA